MKLLATLLLAIPLATQATGRFYDDDNNYRGQVTDDGRFYDQGNNYRGRYYEDSGRLYDENNNFRGRYERDSEDRRPYKAWRSPYE